MDQVAVARVVNAKGTNEVHAFIVPTVEFDLEQLKSALKTRLFPHQIPNQIHLVDKLAETATNKKHRKGMANSLL